MERTKKVEGEAVLKYRKVGGGSLRLNNPYRIIKPNQTFTAKPSEIPEAFKDVVICLSTEEEVFAAKEAELTTTTESIYETVELEDKKGWFNVVKKGEDKPINEKPLRKKFAEELIATLA